MLHLFRDVVQLTTVPTDYIVLISVITTAIVTIISAIKSKPAVEASKQLLPNGGSSLADKVNQIKSIVDQHTEKLDGITSITNDTNTNNPGGKLP